MGKKNFTKTTITIEILTTGKAEIEPEMLDRIVETFILHQPYVEQMTVSELTLSRNEFLAELEQQGVDSNIFYDVFDK